MKKGINDMNQQLPAYLRMQTHAHARPDQSIVCGQVRVTVITPCLIRFEEGAWTDDATLTVTARDLGECTVRTEVLDDRTVIWTDMLKVTLEKGKSLRDGVTVERSRHPAFIWHWGQKALQNLKGTTSTLDQVNGACPLDDGLCSVDGFSVLDDSATPRMLEDGWFAPREEGTDVYFFGYGHDYTACIQDYYRLTGIPELLPAFVLGNWWSRYHAYTEQEYLDLMDRFDEKDVPLSVGIVDMDWHLTEKNGLKPDQDGWTGYTWNKNLFPDYKRFLDALHARGLKTALNLHPAQGVRPWEKQYEAMCSAMHRDPKEQKAVRFNCLNPEFLKAYFEILHFPYEEDGVNFWWMDWQQGTDYRPIAGEDYIETGLDSIRPLWMLNHMHFLASKRNGGRGLIFSRYAGYGSQRYPIGFSGDTYITWDSLAFQPYFTATASNVGYGWWSHDIGGHMGGIRDDELTVRWIQLGVFSPVFRLHSTDSPFLGREPWKYDPRAENVISNFMRLRHRLFPYLYTMNRRNVHDLLPLIRPMYHVSPEVKEAYEVPNVYWFGSEMVAAPITEKADRSGLGRARVWLPEGIWVDAMNGYVYDGGKTMDVYRPLEEMPVFLKAGAMVPLRAHQAHDRTLTASKEMELLAAAGADGAFDLYEDDGESLDYLSGAFAVTHLSMHWQEKQAVITVSPVEGNADLVPERRWKVLLRGFRKGCSFRVNGQEAKAVYLAEKNAYAIDLGMAAPDKGCELTVCCADGLLHDDSDWRDRILDRVSRVQGSQAEKNIMMRCADRALERMHQEKRVHPSWFGGDMLPSLGGYMKELMSQLKIE